MCGWHLRLLLDPAIAGTCEISPLNLIRAPKIKLRILGSHNFQALGWCLVLTAILESLG